MYAPRTANEMPMPFGQPSKPAPKEDLTGDIFKSSGSTQQVNQFARAQDKNAHLFSDLNMFNK